MGDWPQKQTSRFADDMSDGNAARFFAEVVRRLLDARPALGDRRLQSQQPAEKSMLRDFRSC